ncbi:MAG: acyl-CoA dehydrogenase family protein [Dehalococcoidia bacterium]
MTTAVRLDLSPAASSPLIDAAIALQPLIRERADEIERTGRLPSDVVEAIREAGLFHLTLPEDLGGLEADPVTASRVVEEISLADGSAGWCVMIANQNGAILGSFPQEETRILTANRAVMCGTARPIGRAVATEGGYIVSGRWPFASGSSHASWFGGECVVYDGDQPRLDADGNQVTRMCVMPRDSVTIHETWDTTGLRGTASNDFSCENVLVPADRGAQMLVTPPQHPWVLFRAPALVFTNHGSQALGVARAAIENVAAIGKVKSGYGSDAPMAQSPRLQGPIAEATALVESARHYLYAATQQLWDALNAGASDEEVAPLRARVRLATSHAASSSVRAVDLVHAAIGTASLFRKNPIERHFRDIHMAAAHVMIGPLTYEAAGRVELGLEAQFPFF